MPKEPDITPTHIYNPDIKDFVFQMADDKNLPSIHIFPAQEITTMPKYMADHGAKKLADYLVWKRGITTNYELELKETMEEIYVKI